MVRLREQIVDVLGHWPIGSGYYRTSVDVDEARQMADALLDSEAGGPLAAGLAVARLLASIANWDADTLDAISEVLDRHGLGGRCAGCELFKVPDEPCDHCEETPTPKE